MSTSRCLGSLYGWTKQARYMSVVPWWVKLDTLTGDVVYLAHVGCSGISGNEPVVL